MKLVLSSVAFVMLGFGLLGIVTPVLPTTPFILLSLWLFSLSNPKWNQKIKNHPLWSEDVKNWEKNKSISLKSKILATIVITISIASLNVSDAPTSLVKIVSVFLLCTLVFIWTRNTTQKLN